MSTGDANAVTFTEGDTVVRRDVFGGKTWTAAPYRVVADHGDELLLAWWPGVEMLAPTTWIEWLQTGDDGVRKQAIPNLAAGQWELGRWTWRDTTVLSRLRAGDHFSVQRHFDVDHRCSGWYVNIELPHRRTARGIDTFDLLLDLVVEADLCDYSWKDEDEYTQGRRLGLISDRVHAQVDQTRQRLVGLIEARTGPFATDHAAWRRQPDWPTPTLPHDYPEALTQT